MLRPSIQDTFKDQLFDVRDNVRCHFAERRQLGTAAYAELRDALNAYIRFIEVANLMRAYRFASDLARQPNVAELYLRELNRRFDLEDPELTRLARESRKTCSRIIQFYLFHSSFFSVALIYFVLVPMALSQEAFKFCRNRASLSVKSLRLSVQKYVAAREDKAIRPQHTELVSQWDNLDLTGAGVAA
jgi:hypothetical protein